VEKEWMGNAAMRKSNGVEMGRREEMKATLDAVDGLHVVSYAAPPFYISSWSWINIKRRRGGNVSKEWMRNEATGKSNDVEMGRRDSRRWLGMQ
jgi:hypothetical protein